jgi:hypothetical protein
MYDDVVQRPKLEMRSLVPPEEDAFEKDQAKQAKWVLAGFWGRADLVIEQLGVIWRKL